MVDCALVVNARDGIVTLVDLGAMVLGRHHRAGGVVLRGHGEDTNVEKCGGDQHALHGRPV
jgi:hypothetical protein